MNKDLQHLRLPAIFHYIVGALVMAVASIFIFHFGLGLLMLLSPASMGGGTPPPPFMGWMFTLLGGGAVLLGWAIGIGLLLAGRFLSRRTHYIYCMVMAGVALLFQPFGTLLGIFTFIVLLRPSVKHLFETGELPYDPEEDDETENVYDDRIRAGSYNIHGER
jgi:hypothetical protein